MYILIILLMLFPKILFGATLQEVAYMVAVKDANIPVIEKTNNNDHWRIDEYCKSVGVALHSPYCAASVYTWYQDAAKQLGVVNPAYRSGSTRGLYTAALRNPMRYKFIKARDVRLGAEKLMLGDIELFSSNANFTKGHTAFVVKQRDKNSTINIEGNTTNSNSIGEQREQNKTSKNKGGVYNGKIRTISDNPSMKTQGFIRFNK